MDPTLESAGLSQIFVEDDGITRLSRSQATVNSNRLRVGVIPLTLSLIESKVLHVIGKVWRNSQVL